ncbi:hypothetical protein C8Q76DRAFT_698784 [Earliella scabrosa]|nr:hypothetical protein C8Q76DRAFT_698784 [Earliella scabrosa]
MSNTTATSISLGYVSTLHHNNACIASFGANLINIAQVMALLLQIDSHTRPMWSGPRVFQRYMRTALKPLLITPTLHPTSLCKFPFLLHLKFQLQWLLHFPLSLPTSFIFDPLNNVINFCWWSTVAFSTAVSTTPFSDDQVLIFTTENIFNCDSTTLPTPYWFLLVSTNDIPLPDDRPAMTAAYYIPMRHYNSFQIFLSILYTYTTVDGMWPQNSVLGVWFSTQHLMAAHMLNMTLHTPCSRGLYTATSDTAGEFNYFTGLQAYRARDRTLTCHVNWACILNFTDPYPQPSFTHHTLTNSFNCILLMVHHMIGTEHVEEWAVPALVSDRYREYLNDMSEDEEDLEAD